MQLIGGILPIAPYRAGYPGLPSTSAATRLNGIDQVLFGAQPLRKRVEKHYPVVILGGGVAGLTAQYELTKKGIRTLLLESKDRLGGNAGSAVSPHGVPHTIGATILLPGNPAHRRFWKELELPLSPSNTLKPEIYVLPGGEKFTAFGTREEQAEFPPKTDESRQAAEGLRKMLADLKKIIQGKRLAAVAPIQEATVKALQKWDGMSFAEFLKPYGKRVRQLVEPYIQSDLAASSDDVTAYVAMLDIEDLNNKRYILPGGNGFVVQRLAEEVEKRTGQADEFPIRLNSQVEWVEQDKKRAYIKYRDAEGEVRVISADSVLMALPYQQVPQVMDLPPKTVKLMRSLPKSSYSVVNIFLKKTPLNTYQFYMFPQSKLIADLYLTSQNTQPGEQPDFDAPSVMTLYAPHTGRIRNQEKFKRNLLRELRKHLPEVTPEMIEGIRINAFRHAMAAPKPGQVQKLIKMPKTYGRVTLINSDGGAVPSILEAVEEARRGVKIALKKIKKTSNSK